MMHDEDVGARCAYELCRRRDFLPLTCSGCDLVFCDEHGRSRETHRCRSLPSRIMVCPVCGDSVKIFGGGLNAGTKVEENEAFLVHVNSGKCNPAKLQGWTSSSSRVCSAKGCKTLVRLPCDSPRNCVADEPILQRCVRCGARVCPVHAAFEDHDCVIHRNSISKSQSMCSGGGRGGTPVLSAAAPSTESEQLQLPPGVGGGDSSGGPQHEEDYRANGNPLSSLVAGPKASYEPQVCGSCSLENEPGVTVCVACGTKLTKRTECSVQ